MAATGAKTFQNFIGGEWVDAAERRDVREPQPATGELIGAFPKSGARGRRPRGRGARSEAYE